jgi:predicted DNA-binding protein
MGTLTLRLTDEEQQQLEELKNFTDQKTSSGALKEVIGNYMYYIGELERYKQKAFELDNQLRSATTKVKNYIEAKDDLSDMAYGEEWKKEISRRIEAIENGTAELIPSETVHARIKEKLYAKKNNLHTGS